MGWLSGWNYRKLHKIAGTTVGPQSDYQIRIVVHYGNGTDSGENVYLNGKCNPDFSDIRVASDDGETVLPQWIEEKVDNDYAIIWVKITSIPASPDKATIYIYYGNSSASEYSDGEATFIFFDHFEGTELDTTKWTRRTQGTAYITINDSICNLSTPAGTSNRQHIISNQTVGPSSSMLIRYRLNKPYQVRIALTTSYNATYIYLPADDFISSRLTYLSGYNSTFRTVIDDTEQASTIITSPSAGTWYRAELRLYEGHQEMVVDDNTEATHTVTGIPDGTYHAFIGEVSASADSFSVDIDYVAIRKFVYPEPSHDVWGSEEQPASFTASATVTSSINIKAELERYLSVSTQVTPLLSTKKAYHAILSKTVGVSPGLGRTSEILRSLSQNLLVDASLGKIYEAFRQLAISLGVSSGLSVKSLFTSYFTEDIEISIALERSALISRGLSVPISLASELEARKVIKVCGLPDFTVPTAIVAQTIDTLAVDIAAQSIGELGILIKGTEITIPVNITNSTIDVNITNALLDVNITNSLLNVNIAQAIELDVNITNSSLNVNVQNSVLDVNITNAEINANITNAQINVYGQGGELDNINYNDSILKSNCFEGAIGRGDGAGGKYTFAHTPSGYVFYLVGATLSVINYDSSVDKEGWLGVYNPCVGVEQIIADVVVPPGGAQSVDVSLATPVKIPYGGYFFVQADTNAYPVATVRLVLVPASLDDSALSTVMERGKLISIRYPPIRGVDRHDQEEAKPSIPSRAGGG